MKLISLFIMSILLVGCAAKSEPDIIYKTVYQEVKVPVVYKIDRPKRPMYTSNDTAPSYLLKLRQYTMTLETIIDEHNKKD